MRRPHPQAQSEPGAATQLHRSGARRQRSPQRQARRGDEGFDLARPCIHHPRLERVYGVRRPTQAAVVLLRSTHHGPAAQAAAAAVCLCCTRVCDAVRHVEARGVERVINRAWASV